MNTLRYQHLLATIRDLEEHTQAADRLSHQMLQSGLIRDDLAARSIHQQLDARISAAKALTSQIAYQLPQVLEVVYD